MTIKVSVEDGEPVDLADFTESLFRTYAVQIARILQKIERGDFDEVKLLPGQIKQLREVYQLVQEERGRVEKLRKLVAGYVGAGELDFQSARDEVGRRLARLRDGEPG